MPYGDRRDWGNRLQSKTTITTIKNTMPFINVQVIENVFSPEQKKQIITNLTDAMVAIEGEPFRKVTWVKIEEVKEGNWGIAGQPLQMSDIERMRKGG